jgi:hypothetical protein
VPKRKKLSPRRLVILNLFPPPPLKGVGSPYNPLFNGLDYQDSRVGEFVPLLSPELRFPGNTTEG